MIYDVYGEQQGENKSKKVKLDVERIWKEGIYKKGEKLSKVKGDNAGYVCGKGLKCRKVHMKEE